MWDRQEIWESEVKPIDFLLYLYSLSCPFFFYRSLAMKLLPEQQLNKQRIDCKEFAYR